MSNDLGSLGTAKVDVKADLSDLDAMPGVIGPKFAALSTKIDASMSGVRSSTRNVGFAALELSRALEDLQYGINGVVNNIPGLVMSLGGSAGVMAAASLAAVAVNQLVKHWDELTAAFGASATLTEAERMEKLAKATEKTAEAERKLREYKKRQETIKSQEESVSPEQEATAKAVHEALRNPAHGDMVKALTEVARDQLIGTDADARNAADALRKREESLRLKPVGGSGSLFKPRTPEELSAAKAGDKQFQDLGAKLNEALIAAAKNLLSDAENNPERLKALMNAVDDNPDAFPGGVQEKLLEAQNARANELTKKAQEDEAKALKERTDKEARIKAERDQAEDQELKEFVELRVRQAKRREGFAKGAEGAAEGAIEGGAKAIEAAVKGGAKEDRRAEMLDTSSYLTRIALAGQSKADRTPDLIAEGNKLAEKVAENTGKIAASLPFRAVFRKA